MQTRQTIFRTAVFLILILIILLPFALNTYIEQEIPQYLPGYADLSGFNFCDKLCVLPQSSFLYYRGALYTPEDFAVNGAAHPPESLAEVKGRFDPGNCGTYRITLKLPDHTIYGLSSYSAMYAQRLFINGEEYPAFGMTGATGEVATPDAGHYTYYFAPQASTTEIVIQFSNFSHWDYGGIVSVYVGSQENVALRDARSQQRIHLLTGCTLTAAMFFAGMFLYFSMQYVFLWFSLACFSVTLRILIVNEKVLLLLFPGLPWNISIGSEYLSLILLLYSFLQYIHRMFPGALHRYALHAYTTLCGVFAVAVLFSSPLFYTRFMLPFQISTAVVGLYVLTALLWNIARNRDSRHAEHGLVLTGAVAFIVLSAWDIQMHRAGGYALGLGLAEIGMLVMTVASMLALVLRFSRTEAELNIARKNELEMQETNRLLERMSRMKSDFLANISHEMRTPLAVMAGYAGLTSLQMQRGSTDGETLQNLAVIKREAIRLAELVEQIKDVSLEKDRQLALLNIGAYAILSQTVEFCAPIFSKNRNRLLIAPKAQKDIVLHVNAASIFQVLVNLIINANRHTKEGRILLDAHLSDSPELAELSVSDDGMGVEAQVLPRLLERGFSGDASSGLGLSICKEIIEEHSGSIRIESAPGKGFCVRLTLPCAKGEPEHV